jgi:hypothetical protein
MDLACRTVFLFNLWLKKDNSECHFVSWVWYREMSGISGNEWDIDK